jgi:hypothetical protein
MLDSTNTDRAWNRLRAKWRTDPVMYMTERLGLVPTRINISCWQRSLRLGQKSRSAPATARARRP